MNNIKQIIDTLKRLYPEPRCMLSFSKPHELLIAARLSAQCTDKRVNMTTPELFARFPTVESFANADLSEIKRIIKPCGLFNTKAESIKSMCEKLCEVHEGNIPDELDTLLELPGVGRKTANLVLGELYGKPAIVADTHVIRLSNRLGLVDVGKDAFKVEMALRELIPPDESLSFCHRLVLHGRAKCKAHNPSCRDCELNSYCEYPETDSKESSSLT